MSADKCVLAYSGGLDTSAIVPWLIERGYEVHAVLVDVGQEEDLPALCRRALHLGARSAVVRDAQPAMFEQVVPFVIGLAATYEGTYRLGTALARPFIAAEQVKLARQLGGATLVHGATGKGNDQIRFEFAYHGLAPDCPVLAPWKVWDLAGRRDLIGFLKSKGFDLGFEAAKDFSLDENLWHLSVEGGPLEDPSSPLDIAEVLEAVAHRFAVHGPAPAAAPAVRIDFAEGVPTAVDGVAGALPDLVGHLNHRYRTAPWAWDLVIENRFTGIKSRGLYINPAAKLLHLAVDTLARSCLNKPSYDRYAELGRQYGEMLYRGEYFSDQRVMMEAAGRALMSRLAGAVTIQLQPAPYVSQVRAARSLFRRDMATFEKSDYAHQDAAGFIRLSWLSLIGRSFDEEPIRAGDVEKGAEPPSDVREAQPLPRAGLVPSGV